MVWENYSRQRISSRATRRKLTPNQKHNESKQRKEVLSKPKNSINLYQGQIQDSQKGGGGVAPGKDCEQQKHKRGEGEGGAPLPRFVRCIFLALWCLRVNVSTSFLGKYKILVLKKSLLYQKRVCVCVCACVCVCVAA